MLHSVEPRLPSTALVGGTLRCPTNQCEVCLGKRSVCGAKLSKQH